ncbi:MAG: hypothetical protein HY757_06195 [Nitrospirae bacterium]|nr:hypothetical protein [Nitrospirota bacterium]
MKYIKILLLLCIVPIVLSGCSAAKTKTADIPGKDNGQKLVHDTVTIKASGSYEECIELRPGQVFDYEFDASDFVNFNIHYHAESGIQYPVNSQGVRFGKGAIDPGAHKFYTEEQENYCLMWDNLNDGTVKVSYKYVLRKK